MCGITGIFSYGRPIGPEAIRSATDAIRHRGPDDEGFLAIDTASGRIDHLTGDDSRVPGQHISGFASSADLYLGHRRLSIIDPTPSGHQPMANHDSSLWIVFNGEIYNYLELRKELVALGHTFRTSGDTEVILAAYSQWGGECVHRFNGMWALVVFDRRRGVLFGSRDRFGVKPCYYWHDDGRFAFASEIKGLLQIPFVEKRVNPAAVFDYLVMGLEEQGEEGFFCGIHELQPAHNFEIDLRSGAFRKWRYYTLEFEERWQRYDELTARAHVEEVREKLFAAVRLRLRADVTVGSCLSGGVDSSTIVCVINELLKGESLGQVGEKQQVFTACYDRPEIDESNWARMVVEQTRTVWHRTYPRAEELLQDLEDLVYTQDIPFGSTSIYAQYRVMRLARDNGVKVVLDGQGADELFTGYAPYYRAFYAQLLASGDFSRILSELRNMGNAPLRPRMLFASLMKLYLLRHLPATLRKAAQQRGSRENLYLAPDFWQMYRDRLDLVKDKVAVNLNEMLQKYLTSQSLKPLLKYEDRNSMRFSIESRTPFADDLPLIEYVFNVPASYKIHAGWSKSLLREAAGGFLPERIKTRRDKVGFATPEYYWLNELAGRLREYLGDDLGEYLQVGRLRTDWESLLRGQATSGITNIWKFINLGAWLKVYRLGG